MAFGFESRRGGETGRMYEAKILGTYPMTSEFLEAEAALRKTGHGRYVDDEDLFRVIKDHAEGDPTNPESQQANDLRLAVIDALGLEPGNEDRVRYFTAVGTPLDVKLGVDAFFEYDDPETGETSRATVDVTLNTRKLQEGYGKADVVIGELPDAVVEEDDYLDRVDAYGQEIADKLKLRSSRIRKAS